jgi:hypothetical protein
MTDTERARLLDPANRPRNGCVIIDGVKVWDSSWPRCHGCGERSGDLEMLHYRRSDGVPGCSYPDCAACRRGNADRLERLGFTILTGDSRTDHSGRPPAPTDRRIGPETAA